MRAYCIAPFFGSCEGSGTSTRSPPVTGSLEESLDVLVVVGATAVADFVEEDEMKAAGVARTTENGTV